MLKWFQIWLVVASSLWLANGTHAFSVYRLGGGEGNSWKAGISSEPGEYQILDADGQVIGRGTLTMPTTYDSWEDTLAEVVDSLGGEWLRPFYVNPMLNLAQDGVRNRIVRGISSNLVTSGECHQNASQVSAIKPMFDGDPTTAAFFTATSSGNLQIRGFHYSQNSIIDLGVDYPINRVRFFPRLGTSHPKIDAILGKMEEPTLNKEELPEDDFSENFLPWFEVTGANSIHNFAANCYWQTTESPWFKHITSGSTYGAASDPRFAVLGRNPENLDIIVDIRFPTQLLQWVAIRPLNPTHNWEIAEFQVFGEGYAQRVVYTTAVLDFGEPMAWGKIRWIGEIEAGAKLFIRTRSGTDPDPHLYWIPSAIPGEFKPLTRREYERADIAFRSTTLDEEHWGFWSSAYPWEAGLQDTTRVSSAWEDGTPILSPGPRRYLQIQFVFVSTLDHAARLEELEIQFARPSALKVVGEIWPLDASRTESTSFTYSIRPTFDDASDGFDRLEIFTLTRVDAVHAMRIDGVDITGQFPIGILEDRFIVHLPKLQGSADTFKLIEVDFDAHVIRYGTEFQGWVFNSQLNGVKQLIEAGDANVNFPGNALGVRTEGLGEELLTQVVVHPNPFTPNGDGINEEARFHFQLHEVSAPRDLMVSIYDLSGRQVRQLHQEEAIRGLFGERSEDPSWDGQDNNGNRVAPGVYLYRISLDTDVDQREKVGTIVVVY